MIPQYVFKISLLFICVHQLCSSSALSITNASITEKHGEKYLRQIYADMDKGLKDIVRQTIKSALRVFIEVGQELNISSKCMKNGFRLLTGLRDINMWALSFIDASGKPVDGFMSGSSQMLGNYDQCLNSSALKKNGDVDFRGRYCLISYRPFLPVTDNIIRFQDRVALIDSLTQNLSSIIKLYILKSEFLKSQTDFYGLCVPSGCEEKDAALMIKYVEEKILMNLTVHHCHTEDDLIKLTPGRIAIICFFVIFGIFAITGSLIEYYFELYSIEKKNSALKILLCFSLKTNFPKFISTKVSDTKISCLSGIRVLTLFYLILGHHYMTKLIVYVQTNSVSGLGTMHQFFMQIVLNGFLSVDTFFFVGGFLHCYIRWNSNASNTSIWNSFILIIHRLFRIIPVYVAAILFTLLLMPRGPVSGTASRHLEGCTKDWWKNILFIDNFFHGDSNKCLPHSWYLSNDMQYFLVSLITILFLKRNTKIGVAVNIFIIIFSTVFTALWVWMKKLPPTYVFTNVTERDLMNVYAAYVLPFTHAASYFSGVLLGYILATKKNLKLSKSIYILGWTTATLLFLLLLFITKRWNSGVRYTEAESALYFALSRPLYAMSIGWLIFCCFTGKGGIINYILSLKLWIPLSRLSLSAYLISFPLQLFYLGNLRTTMDMQRMRVIWSYFGDLAVTYLLALTATMLFESPFLALEKMIFPKRLNFKSSDDAMKENELKAIASIGRTTDMSADNEMEK